MRFARCQVIAEANNPTIPMMARIMLVSDQIMYQVIQIASECDWWLPVSNIGNNNKTALCKSER